MALVFLAIFFHFMFLLFKTGNYLPLMDLTNYDFISTQCNTNTIHMLLNSP